MGEGKVEVIRKTSGGWQVMNAEGTKELSAPDLSREDAERIEHDIGVRQPAVVWARERGSFVKD